MAQLNEKADYNNSGDFDSYDLDISWAYLQVKKLYELEQSQIESGALNKNDATITPSNFRQKVYDQYATNKQAGIAETTNLEPSVLPGILSQGMPFTLKQPNIVKHWGCNDLFNDEAMYVTRSESEPTSFTESISGTRADCEIIGPTRHTGGNISSTTGVERSGRLFSLSDPSTRVKFYDRGKITNKNWCLHFKAYGLSSAYKSTGTVPLVSKQPNDNYKSGSGFAIGTFSTRIGIYADGSTASNWCAYPDGLKLSDFAWKETDFFIIREGLDVKVFMYHSNYTVGGECKFTSPGSLPSLITLKNLDSPLMFGGDKGSTNQVYSVNDVWIADNIGFDDLPILIANDRHSRTFFQKQTLNVENSFFAYQNQMLDEVGNVAFLVPHSNARYTKWDSATKQYKMDCWVTPPTANNGFVPPTEAPNKCLSLISSKEKFQVPSLNFKGNFSIGFWIQSNGLHTRNIELRNSDYKGLAFQITDTGVKLTNYDTWSTKEITVPGFNKNLWHHIAIVKNGRHTGVWVDDYFKDGKSYISVTRDYINQTGSVDFTIHGGKSTDLASAVYVSSVKVVPYAMTHIPYWDIGKRPSYPFLEILK